MEYDGIWIRGIVNSLSEALEYFDENTKDDEYVSQYVQVWSKIQKNCTFKFNAKSRSLEKQKLRLKNVEIKT